jgi:hypothetical protein
MCRAAHSVFSSIPSAGEYGHASGLARVGEAHSIEKQPVETARCTHSATSQRTPVRLTCRPAASVLTCCTDGPMQCTWKASGLA